MSCEYFRGNGEYIVKGVVKTEIQNPKVLYWAANSPDHRASFSGSGYVPYLDFTATPTGYGNDVIGVSSANIDEVISVATANINEIIGA